ncbi:inositol monophosphatase 1-like [Bacillus rossius redtenbacheri]|uniref:inositol monophosphatase 1-like n=1 Tax=Bacillus rossius redtenbacheri TaxID=93214 RepID=UPI002FDE34EC
MQRQEVEDCFATAVELVREAGKIVMEGFRSEKKVSKKTHAADLVTGYDTRVEVFLISSLKRKYPSHQFIGEESSFAEGSPPALSDAPTWIIDPIDGTMNFVHGLPLVAVCVALAVNRKAVIGIVYNPVLEQLYTAVAGRGALLNSEPIRVSSVTDMTKALVNFWTVLPKSSNDSIPEVDYGLKNFLKRITHGHLELGSCAVELCFVAAGSIDAFCVNLPNIGCWDLAAAALIVQEAGGVLVDPETGGEFDMMKCRIFCAGTNELATSVLKEVNHFKCSTVPK